MDQIKVGYIGPEEKIFYVHYNGASWFVKEAEFFSSQKGHEEEWGKAWTPIRAQSIAEVRTLCEQMGKSAWGPK